jgi:hypothetical protein
VIARTSIAFIWLWRLVLPAHDAYAQGALPTPDQLDQLLAPVEYGASGVMTFLVSRRGTVFQKDLGDSTADTAKAIKAFDPDSSWNRVSNTQ